MKIGQHSLYLGLLEHDFGDPDLVGRIGHTPRKLAAVGVKPREEALPQLAEVICRIGGFFFAWHLLSSRNGNSYLEWFRSIISATCRIISSGEYTSTFLSFREPPFLLLINRCKRNRQVNGF